MKQNYVIITIDEEKVHVGLYESIKAAKDTMYELVANPTEEFCQALDEYKRTLPVGSHLRIRDKEVQVVLVKLI